MKIYYDVAYDDAIDGPMQFIDKSFHSKQEALQALADQRRRFPTAYLVKSVMTRCREGSVKNGR